MIGTDWQQAVAIAIVAATAVYLGWRIWRRLAGKPASGCAACSACPKHRAADACEIPPKKVRKRVPESE